MSLMCKMLWALLQPAHAAGVCPLQVWEDEMTAAEAAAASTPWLSVVRGEVAERLDWIGISICAPSSGPSREYDV